MILGMGKVNSVGKMEKNIKDNGNVVWSMDPVFGNLGKEIAI
jgi:pyridoxal/pyridoxine/pyridoxamine kinase